MEMEVLRKPKRQWEWLKLDDTTATRNVEMAQNDASTEHNWGCRGRTVPSQAYAAMNQPMPDSKPS
ncbi:hypothetical protein AMTR_s00074p00121480 [Amborella trichopoda]|uniref:Uncharacterized protein n=1 Tax=Amborella trichopoda TaxID=13333 RepID=W1NQ63_AMBTC|nr:hypothetical protein AMTR_s00074p00121480 [Amborella trichopoda]